MREGKEGEGEGGGKGGKCESRGREVLVRLLFTVALVGSRRLLFNCITISAKKETEKVNRTKVVDNRRTKRTDWKQKKSGCIVLETKSREI